MGGIPLLGSLCIPRLSSLWTCGSSSRNLSSMTARIISTPGASGFFLTLVAWQAGVSESFAVGQRVLVESAGAKDLQAILASVPVIVPRGISSLYAVWAHEPCVFLPMVSESRIPKSLR